MHRYHDDKIGIRNLRTQSAYAHLARRFATMRKESGLDPLMQSDQASAGNILRELTPKGFWAEHRTDSQHYAETAHHLYHTGLRLVHMRRLFFHAFVNNPFNPTLWKLIFSPEFRNRSARALRRRLPGSHRQQRETG
jgi:hypothetical protein